jgi:uncharacterized membrane protein
MATQAGRLVAFAFDDPYKADEARAALNRMAGEGLLEIDETALIVKNADGKVRLSQDVNIVDQDKKVGHVAGLIAAAVTGTMPFILAGTVAGKLIGKLSDHGITNRFLDGLKQEVQPGTSALVLYGRSQPERRQQVIERLAVFRPKILESDVPPELEKAFDDAIAAATGRTPSRS